MTLYINKQKDIQKHKMTTATTETPHERPWGNQIQPKEMKTIQLLLKNIGGLELTS